MAVELLMVPRSAGALQALRHTVPRDPARAAPAHAIPPDTLKYLDWNPLCPFGAGRITGGGKAQADFRLTSSSGQKVMYRLSAPAEFEQP